MIQSTTIQFQMNNQKRSISLKKQVFHQHIRQNQLQKMFRQERALALQHQLQYHPIHSHIDELIRDLPATIVTLRSLLIQQPKTALSYFLFKVDQIGQRIVQPSVVQWSAFSQIANKLLICTNDKNQIQKITKATLLPLLQNFLILYKQHRYRPSMEQLMQVSLQYCFRFGKYAYNLNRLEEQALIATIAQHWIAHKNQQSQKKLLIIIYNILVSTFDEQDQQNTSASQKLDLQHFKCSLITKVFYQKQQALQILGQRICILSMEQTTQQQAEVLTLYLKIVILITFHMGESIYYYKLLSQHIVTSLQSNILLSNKQALATILTLRIFNNLLVTDAMVTHTVMKDLLLSKLIKEMYNSVEHNKGVQIQITQLFINLMHFMNDDLELITYLIQLGVGQLIIHMFEMDEQYLNDDSLKWAVNALIIMYAHCPKQTKAVITDNRSIISKAFYKYPYQAETIQQLYTAILPEYLSDLELI